MVIAQKVKNAVDQKIENFILHGLSHLPGLTPGGLYRDHHLTQEFGGWRGGPRRAHRKGDYIGRAIPTEIPAIERGDGRIIDEDDAQLTFPTFQVF
jgi:hypothetical protein